MYFNYGDNFSHFLATMQVPKSYLLYAVWSMCNSDMVTLQHLLGYVRLLSACRSCTFWKYCHSCLCTFSYLYQGTLKEHYVILCNDVHVVLEVLLVEVQEKKLVLTTHQTISITVVGSHVVQHSMHKQCPGVFSVADKATFLCSSLCLLLHELSCALGMLLDLFPKDWCCIFMFVWGQFMKYIAAQSCCTYLCHAFDFCHSLFKIVQVWVRFHSGYHFFSTFSSFCLFRSDLLDLDAVMEQLQWLRSHLLSNGRNCSASKAVLKGWYHYLCPH